MTPSLIIKELTITSLAPAKRNQTEVSTLLKDLKFMQGIWTPCFASLETLKFDHLGNTVNAGEIELQFSQLSSS